MSNGMFIAAAGMLAEDARADVIANNLANVRTAGFRKDFISFRQRLMRAQSGTGVPGQSVPGLVIDRTAWDRQPGPAALTGRPLDLAIQGDGWFSVQRDGRTFFTRAGNFSVNSQGRLATGDGQAEVLSTGGTPISLTGASKIEINARGEVLTQDGVAATLGVVQFDRPELLEKFGDALMTDPGGAGLRAATAVDIVPGALEQSSVEPVREMTAMITAFRAYEMNSEVLRMQDELLGKAANEVGRLQA
ncbi:MAG: flagellar hook-basal body protein [Planctomycetes bacterium]|nr:flagellar hook-basal body protein [Planctomycetota bacterium]